MLGYVLPVPQRAGAVDTVLASLATALAQEGLAVAGAVQINTDRGQGLRSDMSLSVLGRDQDVLISQDLGREAVGCRLDPDGLEHAVGLVEADLRARRPDLVILNKFGKQEADGRGFRPVIARALDLEVPVLIGLSQSGLAPFQLFAGGLGDELPAQMSALLAWSQAATRP